MDRSASAAVLQPCLQEGTLAAEARIDPHDSAACTKTDTVGRCTADIPVARTISPQRCSLGTPASPAASLGTRFSDVPLQRHAVLRMASVKQQRRLSAVQVHPLLSMTHSSSMLVRQPTRLSAERSTCETVAEVAPSICIRRLYASSLFVQIYSQPDVTLGTFLVATVLLLIMTGLIWIGFGKQSPWLCQLPAAGCMALVTTTTVLWWLLGPPFRHMVLRHVLLLAELPCMMTMQLVACFVAEERIPFGSRFTFTYTLLIWQLALSIMIVSVEDDSSPSASAAVAMWKILYPATDRGIRTMSSITDCIFINLLFRLVCIAPACRSVLACSKSMPSRVFAAARNAGAH